MVFYWTITFMQVTGIILHSFEGMICFPWLTDVGHNSWWHMKCAQHAAHNPKLKTHGIIQTSLVVAIMQGQDNFQWLVKQKFLRSFWPNGFKVGKTNCETLLRPFWGQYQGKIWRISCSLIHMLIKFKQCIFVFPRRKLKKAMKQEIRKI